MSQGKYIKLISHIITNNDDAIKTAETLLSELEGFICSVYGENADESSWKSFSHSAENGFDKITAEFYEVVGGQPEKKINDILSVIDTLNNGSYGMMLADSDYGVLEYKCYGNAEFSEITEEKASGFIWSTDDYLCLEKSFDADELAEMLDCDADEVCDEIEDSEETAEELIPEIFSGIYQDFSVEQCETDEDDDMIKVRFMFGMHDHSTEQLIAMKNAFEDYDLSSWTLRLSESSEENGKYQNCMICPENNAVVSFVTSCGNISDFSFTAIHRN